MVLVKSDFSAPADVLDDIIARTNTPSGLGSAIAVADAGDELGILLASEPTAAGAPVAGGLLAAPVQALVDNVLSLVRTIVPADLGNVRQVSAGWSHSVALRAFPSGGGSALTCPYSQGDLDASDTIDGVDLAILLSLWGAVAPDIGDLDLDGIVGAGDLSILLGSWGLPPCFKSGC